MKILRSFPSEPFPPGRAYVQDGLERFVTPQAFDYTGLKQLPAGEDVVLLEWDIAVNQPDLEGFVRHWANGNWSWPAVAPFKSRDGSKWMHWNRDLEPIRTNEGACHLFGFGLVYLPRWVIDGYPPGYGGSSIMSDGSLPRWLQEAHGPRPVPVDWSVTIVHLG